MKMDERKKYFARKAVLCILFAAFWGLSAVHLFVTEGNREMAIGILYLILFLPITIAILLDYDVFSLFVIILYEAAMLIMSIVMLSKGLASKELNTFDTATLFVSAFFSLFLIASAVEYLRNKPHILKIPCLIFSIGYITMVIISFFQNGVFTFDTFYDFFKNLIVILIFSIYIITFPHVQLQIFKDEK